MVSHNDTKTDTNVATILLPCFSVIASQERNEFVDVDVSFGEWLRRRRKSLDLTQKDLAQQIGCSEITIRKIEADERRPSKHLVERLADTLMITATQRRAFASFARGSMLSPPTTLPIEPPTIPADSGPPLIAVHLPVMTTALVGRTTEVADARALLRRPGVRLVTFTGPGGTGKTRLSVQVASELLHEFDGNVCFVALAAINDPAFVVHAIAQALGVKETDTSPLLERLKQVLAPKRLLLVLDNFEQVADAAPLITLLLNAAPLLTILVTSRTLLRISGEHEYAVLPLALPQTKRSLSLSEVAEYPAVQLFVQRATIADPYFQLTPTNASTIIEICRQLDGLPLALELAAGWIKLLSPPALLARLRRRLPLLTGGPRDLPARQQTLRSTIDWSYALLDANEQALFCQLAVFVGGWTLRAAESICGGDEPNATNVLDGLLSLLDKNLLKRELMSPTHEQADPRFGMLETIREYALEKLAAQEDAPHFRHRHALYYLALAQEVDAALTGPAQVIWLAVLDHELDNLRAALEWFHVHGGTDGLRLAVALGSFWEKRGYLSEGRQYLAQLLVCGEQIADPNVHAKALNVAGRLAWYQGDLLAAREHYEMSLAISQTLDDQPGISRALNNLGNIAYDLGDYAAAHDLHSQSLTIRRALNDQRGIAASLNNLGNIATLQGDYNTARTLHEQSLGLRRTLGDKAEIAPSLNNLGEILRWQGEFARAEALFEEGLAIFHELGHRYGIAFMYNNLGLATLYQHDYEQAQKCFTEGLALFRELGAKQGIAVSLNGLGRVATKQGDYAQAQTLLVESLMLFQTLGDKQHVADTLERLAALAAVCRQIERVVQLCALASALRLAIDAPRAPIDQPSYETLLAAARAALDDAVWNNAWTTGETMTTEEVLLYVQREV